MSVELALAPSPASASPISQAVLDDITERLAANAEAYDRSGEFPAKNFEILAEKNLIGLTVSPEFGGGGAGLTEALRVLSAVAKGDPSTALILFMTYSNHATPTRAQSWPGHLYEQLAREAVAGGGLIGGLRVEPELGTPVRGGMPKTTARRTADGWAISGEKIYSTGSTGLTWYVVWAKTDEAEPRVGSFLVRAGSPGISIEPEWDHFGMRATVSHKVVLSETPIPLDHAVDVRPPIAWAPKPGENNQGIWNALAISTIYDGVAQSARHWLKDYLNTRIPSNLGAPLSSLPRVQEKFGEIDALLYANRVLIETAAQRADDKAAPSAVEVNSIKYLVTNAAVRAVDIALDLTGNPGLSRNNPLERHYRDVRCSRIHSPQDDTILINAGKSGLGV